MNRAAKKVAIGSAVALLASSTMAGAASAAPGSLAVGSLGSTAPEFTSPYELHPHEDVKRDNQCSAGENYSTVHRQWEINWGMQYADQHFVSERDWDSTDFGGLTYVSESVDQKYSTDDEALAGIREYDENHPDVPYHWWYTTRDMVSDGAELTLAFEDGDVILGEVMVGSDQCPSVRWTHFPPEGEPETDTPETFPEGAPAPTRPVLPPDSPDTPTGSLASFELLIGS